MAFNSQRQGATAAPPQPDTQGNLVITKAPDGARGLLGTSLVAAGALSVVGAYEAEIMTDGWLTVEVALRASAVSGTVNPVLKTRWADGTDRDTATGSNLVANTMQEYALTALNGQRRAYVTFSLDAAESVTFNRAEFNGL